LIAVVRYQKAMPYFKWGDRTRIVFFAKN